MDNRRLIGLLRRAWLGCLLLGLAAGPACAGGNRVVLNFVNADIETVLNAYTHMTGRNFVIDPRVKGTITIVSAHPVSRTTAFNVLLSALRMQGYAAVVNGDLVKILPEADAKQQPSPTASRRLRAHGAQIVTQVYPLEFQPAQSLASVLRPLVSPNNSVAVLPDSNTLILTDYADNIHRLDQIIAAVDQPSSSGLTVIPVQHASALDLAQTVNQLLAATAPGSSTGGATTRLTVLPDARTNSLLVWTDNPARLERVRSLVATLDVSTAAAGNMHVVYLRNAEAVKLVETLRGLITGAQSQTTVAATPTSPPALAGSSSAGSPPAVAATAAHGAPVVGNNVSIEADAASNALVITAPENVYNALRSVIDKLDARPAEVYIEALIVEVTTDKQTDFGIQWQAAGNFGHHGGALFGGANFNARGSGNNLYDVAGGSLPNAANGLNVGYVRGQIQLPGMTSPVSNLAALAQALSNDSLVNVLSTPNLVTLDNEEAQIVVGENVPFITGSYSQAGTGNSPSTINPFETIERQDVGLTLKVKPQVAEGGSVKLQIHQEVSDVADKTNPAGIITDKRSIDSTVMVDDGQIIVLGGLIQDDLNAGNSRIPGLSSIPLIGRLFRYDSRERKKTNLMVFLRPYVLRKESSYDRLTQDRYEYIRNAQLANQLPPLWGKNVLPGPVLQRPVILPAPADPTAAPGPQPRPGASTISPPDATGAFAVAPPDATGAFAVAPPPATAADPYAPEPLTPVPLPDAGRQTTDADEQVTLPPPPGMIPSQLPPPLPVPQPATAQDDGTAGDQP